MANRVGTAQYFPWEGGSIFVGMSGAWPAHIHQAIQLCFLFDGNIRLRVRDDDPWCDYALAIVPSQQRHGMDGSGNQYGAVLFVEPETRDGRLLAARYPRGAIASMDRAPIAALLPELLSAVLERRGRSVIVELAQRLVRQLTGDAVTTERSDERVLRAVAYINNHLSMPIALREVAAVACLSPDRFRHLFAEQVGMGLRPYMLWRRFLCVWEQTMNGASLSTAAHAAGFADSAHLTRTCRRMMGIPPSLFEVSTGVLPSSSTTTGLPCRH